MMDGQGGARAGASLREWSLVIVKNLLFHIACRRDARRYFGLKGRLMVGAASLGLYEGDYLRWLPRLVRAGSDAVDVGANGGAYTRALARALGPGGCVFAFEPIPELAAALEGQASRWGNVHVFREVLSSRSEEHLELRVPCLPGGVPEPALAAVARGPAAPASQPTWRSYYGRASRLDDYIERFRDLSFVKADVEGHEMAFLEGAIRTISAFRPVLQLESAGIAGGEAGILEWASPLGYEFFGLSRGTLVRRTPGATPSLNVYLIPNHVAAALPGALRPSSAGA